MTKNASGAKNEFDLNAARFTDVTAMTTRPMPVPGLSYPQNFYQLEAKLSPFNTWEIVSHHNLQDSPAELSNLNVIVNKAFEKHFPPREGSNAGVTPRMDSVFLIFQDLENSLFSHAGLDKLKTSVTDKHFSLAYACLPKQYHETIEQLGALRDERYGEILPPVLNKKPAFPKPRYHTGHF